MDVYDSETDTEAECVKLTGNELGDVALLGGAEDDIGDVATDEARLEDATDKSWLLDAAPLDEKIVDEAEGLTSEERADKLKLDDATDKTELLDVVLVDTIIADEV